MDDYNVILRQQVVKNEKSLLKKHQLICRQMQYGKEEPIYIAKQHWTNRFNLERESTIGIFFAIWVSPTLIDKEQFAYNIHSKALAKLPGYKAKPRKFADEFRQGVEKKVSRWPGIRLDYGPSTLLQGYDSCHLDVFGDKIADRIADFVSIHEEIDELLEASAI